MTRPNPQGFPQTLVVAHRGASADHPENTLAAFRAAVEAGSDMVELDARLTADGVPVVLHDPDLSRTTGTPGLARSLTLAEIKRADASGGRGPRQEVPTLGEVLGLLSASSTGVLLEVKCLPGEPDHDPERPVLPAVLQAVSEASFPGEIVVASFDPETVSRSRQLAPEIPTGLITIGALDAREALRQARAAGHAYLLPNVPALLEAGRALVREARDAGLRLGTWTVDDEPTLRTVCEWGIDAVATNRPALGVRVRDEVAR